MKILVVCQHYWPENFRVTEISEELVRRGHQVTALVGLPNYPTGVIPEEYRRHQNRRQVRNGVEIRRCFEIGRQARKSRACAQLCQLHAVRLPPCAVDEEGF